MRGDLRPHPVTVWVYPEDRFAYEQVLDLCDSTTPVRAHRRRSSRRDRVAVHAGHSRALRYAAGNFYINDKPTGAVVGQQPFGGSRASGTNDKAGTWINLERWVSPRSIKETYVPATDYRYPYMKER